MLLLVIPGSRASGKLAGLDIFLPKLFGEDGICSLALPDWAVMWCSPGPSNVLGGSICQGEGTPEWSSWECPGGLAKL